MMRSKQLVVFALAGGVLTALQVSCGNASSTSVTENKAKNVQKPALKGYFRTKPWMQGGYKQALNMSVAGTTIPLSQYSVIASKDNQKYAGVLVGSSPFVSPLSSANIPVVVVPLKVTIGSDVFDPSAPDSCDSNVSALTRFRQSPLVNDVPNLAIGGVNVGNAQYINGLRRAEFWNSIQGSVAYQNELSVTYANTYELTTAMVSSHGSTYGSGCTRLGLISSNWVDGILQNTVIPALRAAGTVSPKAALFFLLKNTVQSEMDPPTINSCCVLGYHSATGSPVLTYGTMTWDTSGDFGADSSDASISSHELGEWMDDPLGNNPTPPWGNTGQVQGCQTNWEVGDPLSGHLMPAITMNGKAYQMQELAFFSWFFNKNGSVSAGAGGLFSTNGTFRGPSQPCPPGGSY